MAFLVPQEGFPGSVVFGNLQQSHVALKPVLFVEAWAKPHGVCVVMELRKGAFSLPVVHDQHGNAILFVAHELRMYPVS